MKLLWIMTALVPLLSAPLAQAGGLQSETDSGKSTTEKPWDQVFEDGFKQRHGEDTSGQSDLLKARWGRCSNMVGQTNMVANTVASVKDNPEDYDVSEEQNREQFEDLFPTDTGTYEDTLNAKILDLAYKHWELGRGEAVSSDKLSRKAWDWCINQPPEKFKDL